MTSYKLQSLIHEERALDQRLILGSGLASCGLQAQCEIVFRCFPLGLTLMIPPGARENSPTHKKPMHFQDVRRSGSFRYVVRENGAHT